MATPDASVPPTAGDVVPPTAGDVVAADRAPRGARHAVRAFRYRGFALFWTGALISNVGSWMQNATIPYVLLVSTGNAVWVGIATFAQFFPSVVFGPLGGALADRFPRRTVLLVTQSSMAMVALALWGAWVSGFTQPLLVVGLVAVGGCIAGLMIPSWQAYVSELVPRDALLNAVTLNSAQFNAARALGPAAGGAVLARFGPSWAFLTNAVSFVAVVGALVAVGTSSLARPTGRPAVMRQFVEGVRYLRARPALSRAVTLVFIVAAVGNPVVPLVAVLAERVYDVDAGLYGLMTGALGAGAVLGALVLGAYGSGIPRSRLVAVTMTIYAASTFVVGISREFAVGVAALAVAGAAYLAVVSTLNTTVQLLVDEALRGRVIAVYVMAFTAGFPIGALVQGWVAEQVGAPATIVGASTVLLAVGVLLVIRPTLVEMFDEAHARPLD